MNSINLVFGCTGQDGSYLSKSLLEKNLNVIGISRTSKKNIINHKKLGIDNQFTIAKGNLCNCDEIENLINKYSPNKIYNLSAQSSVGKSFINPIETHKSIVESTINLLETAKRLNYHGEIFFAGSSEIYGNTLEPAKIDSKIDIRSPYAIAKYQSMLLVKFYRETYNLRCMTGVLFNHESPLRGDDFVTQKIINGAISAYNNKSHKLYLGNIDIIRDWGDAEEYVEGIQKIINSEIIKDYIICTGQGTKLKDFIKITFKKLNLDWKKHVEQDKQFYRKNDISKSVGNPYEMAKDLHWKSNRNINYIIDNLLNTKLKN
tara:strand:- start:6 stop:959 length:954 start_codon:yes stop_codon:yes gene_type:complete